MAKKKNQGKGALETDRIGEVFKRYAEDIGVCRAVWKDDTLYSEASEQAKADCRKEIEALCRLPNIEKLLFEIESTVLRALTKAGHGHSPSPGKGGHAPD